MQEISKKEILEIDCEQGIDHSKNNASYPSGISLTQLKI